MNNLSTNKLIIGSGILTVTGNSLYLNGNVISGGSAGSITIPPFLETTTGNQIYSGKSVSIPSGDSLTFNNSGTLSFKNLNFTLPSFVLSNNPTSTFSSFDPTGAKSIDFYNRMLFNSNGAIVIDWNNGLINNTTNSSINWSSKNLYNNSSISTLNWNSRILSGDWQAINLSISGSPVMTESTSEIIIKSPRLDFKATGNYYSYTVPANKLLAIDTMEVITTNITTPSSAPTVAFGYSGNYSGFAPPTLTTSNSLYSRHIFDFPQDAVASGTPLTATILSASTASIHSGYLIYKGYLLTS